MNNKILVLGGAGFIGSNLIAELLNQTAAIEVTSIGRGRVNINDSRFKHFSCDINLSNLNTIYSKDCHSVDFDFIFNCAGTGSVAVAHHNPLDDFKNTPLCVYEILEFIRTNALKSVYVQISSAAVYGSSDKLPMCINDKLSPVSVYGMNNLIAENVVSMYAGIYKIPSTIVRLFSVYGAGLNKQLIWDACNKFKTGNSTFFGTGQEIRDWIHVTDAVKTLINAAKNTKQENLPLTIYNGGSGVERNIREVIEQLALAYEYPESISFCGELKVGDPIGLLAEVDSNINANEVDFAEGINDYVAWFKGL